MDAPDEGVDDLGFLLAPEFFGGVARAGDRDQPCTGWNANSLSFGPNTADKVPMSVSGNDGELSARAAVGDGWRWRPPFGGVRVIKGLT